MTLSKKPLTVGIHTGILSTLLLSGLYAQANPNDPWEKNDVYQQTIISGKAPIFESCSTRYETIAEHLPQSSRVTYLNLSYCPIHNQDNEREMEALGQSLKENTAVKKLNLSHSEIDSEAIVALFTNGLAHNKTLEELNLSHNKLKGWAMQDIAQFAQDNTHLRILDLSDNELAGNNSQKFRQIAASPSLEVLNLSQTQLSEEVFGAFANGMLQNKNAVLQKLNVSRNNIGRSGARHVGFLIEQNMPLENIDVSYCGINGEALSVFLLRGLSKNTNLQELYLQQEKPFSAEEVKALKKLISATPQFSFDEKTNTISRVLKYR